MKSEEYIVTARKYRPKIFEEVVGQDHIIKTLVNALNSGKIHHAYLFSGPRGVGKTTTARIYARELIKKGIEEKNPELLIDLDLSNLMDIIEIDGASNNSVDDIRILRDNSKYTPSMGKYKIYVIDEVHMLTTNAFNALLKTLEEPPPHLLFIFATTEAHKLPATILSRCQRFDFKRMPIKDIISQLKMIAEKDNITIDEQSLLQIAKKADGSMRDSQSIFDQAVAFCGNSINSKELSSALNLIDEDFFFNISSKVLQNDSAGMFEIAHNVLERGYDIKDCLNGLIEHFRNILNYISTKDLVNLNISSENIDYLKKYSEHFSVGDLIKILNILNETERELRFAFQPQIRFELALIQLANITKTRDINELIKILKNTEFQEEKKNSNSELTENTEFVINEEKYTFTSKVKAEVIENKKENLENTIEKKEIKIDKSNLSKAELFIIEKFGAVEQKE